MLILMFLQPGTIDTPLYPGQATVQKILVILAMIQIPILLFLNPYMLLRDHYKARREGYMSIGETPLNNAWDGEADDEEDGHPSGRPSINSADEVTAMAPQHNYQRTRPAGTTRQGTHQIPFRNSVQKQIFHKDPTAQA